MGSEVSVFLYLTDKCNLSCSHCYVMSGPSAVRGTMPRDTIRKALDIFERMGETDVRLMDGEPTVHPEFLDVVTELRHRCQGVRLVSNGMRLYRDSNLKDVLYWLDLCWISAYGTTPERHSSIAGQGALEFRELQQWVGKLSGDGCKIGLSVLLSPGD